jgi:cation-transporting ATPase E
VFARIKPEQKEKIIEALKQDGFTAMIGDGANDALAIKKADLGIAMFDGAQATRQTASVVLVKNSFIDLPNGVKLADSIIQNIEICASIFFNEVFLGFFFFILVTVFGYSFPFTPLNIAFLTYFTIGLPCALIFYWVVRPVHDHVAKPDTSFLKRVIPFALISAIPQVLVTVAAFYSSLEHIKLHAPTSVVVLSFIIVGVIFFMCAPSVYSGPTLKIQKRQFYLLVIIEVISVVALINIPLIASFYNLTVPSLPSVIELVPLISVYALVQYGLARRFSTMLS